MVIIQAVSLPTSGGNLPNIGANGFLRTLTWTFAQEMCADAIE